MAIENELERQKRNITLLGLGVNLLLGIGKVTIGVLGHSAALLADGLHSFSDLASDLLVYITLHYSARQADMKHPYGHGRFETMATVVFGLVLVSVAGGMGWSALQRAGDISNHIMPSAPVLWMCLISILANELLYQYAYRIGRKAGSLLLQANAWHHRSDAISSVLVLCGVVFSWLGWPLADTVAAVLVAIMIAHIAFKMVWDSVQELVDTALPTEQQKQLAECIRQTEGVTGLHALRTRRMNGQGYLDVHITVDPLISVSEGHMIGLKVRQALINQYSSILADVLVHVDCEDDRQMSLSVEMPTREEILHKLREHWRDLAISSRIERIGLHYVQGKIVLELYLPLDVCRKRDEFVPEVEALVRRCENFVSAVRVYYTGESVQKAQQAGASGEVG